jgi:nucleotide-binding universal stress UspA family protein
LKTACELARRFGAQIELLNVIEPMPTSELLVAQAYDYPIERIRNDLSKLPPASMGPQPVRRAVKIGYPADVIISYAREIDADLIVLGTHGRTGLTHLLLGSVAERVVQRAHCAVLVTRMTLAATEKPSAGDEASSHEAATATTTRT